jgi:hypothetical protein
MLAAVTSTVRSMPPVSKAMWSSRPLIFFPAS